MKKHIDNKKSTNKKSLLSSKITKAIPLSVAISLISAGTAFGADHQITQVRVKMDDKNFATIDTTKLNDNDYKTKVYEYLTKAFENGESILISEKGDPKELFDFVDFGKGAGVGVTVNDMFEDKSGLYIPYSIY